MQTIIDAVRDANPSRTHENIERRLGKLCEELGEVAQAYLAVSSAANAKGMSWDDVREEIADSLIVALDVVMTPLPNGTVEFVTDEQPVTFADRSFWTVYGAAIKEAGGALSLIETVGWGGKTFGHARRALEFVIELSVMPMPDESDVTARERFEALSHMVDLKLLKWARNRAQQLETTRVVDDAV